MKIGYSKKFKKQYSKLPKNVSQKFDQKLVLFLDNQRDERLNIHKLHGKLKNLHSLNVTGDIRAIFDQVSSNKIEFVAIGSHSSLYS